ncbi:Hypothetical predicted protein [Mytilus galloprovincialis]|uniref:RING-type domain-containing protein n=1 Tax=Mytilus galloprovincialis TaxID=29158 RepID=A0A8B6HD69_MYTGA|nr:Hypothetical predicted protein [Mytilus galloprovincialis]
MAQAVEKELICPICADYFTSPKGLPCLHTFCRDCLKSHIMSQVNKGQFSCPMCRTRVPAPEEKPRSEWVDIFPTNHHVVSIMDIVVPNFEPIYCKICKERGLRHKAVKHCKLCVEDFCLECARLHNLFNATKTHSLSEIENKQRKPDTRQSASKTPDRSSKCNYDNYIIKAKFKGSIDLKTDHGDEPSFITSLIFLDDDRIVAADNCNYKIKLFESEGKFLSEICQVRPFGLTLIHQTYIASTEAGYIKFFHVYPNKIKIEKTYNAEWKIYTPHAVPVSNALRGLHYCNGQFVVCSGDDLDKHVTVLDANGKNQHHIWKKDSFRGNMFKDPWYCKLSDNLEDIYISDGTGVFGSVKCVSNLGQEKWEYSCQMPRAIDIIGNHVCVADWREDEIKVLTKDGKFVKTLLNKEDGIRRPQAIAVNHSGDKLIVANSPPYSSDVLLLFDLEYKKTDDTKTSSKKTTSSLCTLC